jgi:hypothetical protein
VPAAEPVQCAGFGDLGGVLIVACLFNCMQLEEDFVRANPDWVKELEIMVTTKVRVPCVYTVYLEHQREAVRGVRYPVAIASCGFLVYMTGWLTTAPQRFWCCWFCCCSLQARLCVAAWVCCMTLRPPACRPFAAGQG